MTNLEGLLIFTNVNFIILFIMDLRMTWFLKRQLDRKRP